MPACETKYFGRVSYENGATVQFAAGLPGFETLRCFLLLEDAARKPVVFLQSLEDAHLCFLTVPVWSIDPGYNLKIPDDDLQALGLASDRQPAIGTEVICLAIVSVAADGTSTANLLAPVVIRRDNGMAVQAVRDDAQYGSRHLLLGPVEEAPCS
jgi:flagellar assembly factor FliW